MSLVDQIYRQVEGATSKAPPYAGQAFAEGMKMGLDQQRIDLAKAEEYRAALLFPLQRKLLQQNMEMGAAKLEDFLSTRQSEIDHQSVLNAVTSQASDDLAAGNPIAARKLIMDVQSRVPGIYRTPRFIQLQKDVQAALDAHLEQQKWEKQFGTGTDRSKVGTFSQQLNPETGKMETIFRSSVSGAQRVPSATFTPEIKTVIDSETKQGIQMYEKAPGEWAPVPKGTTLRVRPDGTVEFVQGGAGGDMTIATKTRLQEQEMSNDEALSALTKAISGIEEHPEAMGVMGMVGSGVEQAKGQLRPREKFATPITDVRQKASLAFSRIAPALRIDSGNMSKYELNQLEEAGYVLNWEEAPQTALNKLQNLRNVVLGKQLRIMKIKGQTPDNALLMQIPNNQLEGMLKANLLSREDANRFYRLKANAK